MGEQFKMKTREIINVYDKIVLANPEYSLMIEKISSKLSRDCLEIGVGTGLLTDKLIRNTKISDLGLIEPDQIFVKRFFKRFPERLVDNSDGIYYQHPRQLDFIAMSLVYHHIPDGDKQTFLRNMYRNLKDGGLLVMGDVFLLPYLNDGGRNDSLIHFHQSRIFRLSKQKLADIERIALEEGLKRSGEWKTSYNFLEHQLRNSGFRNIYFEDIGNQNTGGYKIVIAEK